jgi:hypothetical protein
MAQAMDQEQYEFHCGGTVFWKLDDPVLVTRRFCLFELPIKALLPKWSGTRQCPGANKETSFGPANDKSEVAIGIDLDDSLMGLLVVCTVTLVIVN